MRKILWVLLSGIMISIPLRAAQKEFRAFTDTSGRTIEAHVENYVKGSRFVFLELTNGKSGKVPLSTLCTADHEYLKQWLASRCFMDEKLFSIKIEEEATSWKDLGDGRDEKTTSYKFFLTNNNDAELRGLRAEYCLYRDRKKYIDTSNYTLELVALPAKKEYKAKTRSNHLSFRRKSSDFYNHVEGIRLRFYMTAPGWHRILPRSHLSGKAPVGDPSLGTGRAGAGA